MSKLGWTLVLALVFSAGLITGQRLIRSETTAPLVSVTAESEADSPAAADDQESSEQKEPVFSFYDKLSKGIDPVEKKEQKDGAVAKKNGQEKADGTKPSDEAKDRPAEEAARYTLQVSAHSEMKQARLRSRKLQQMGLEPHIVSAQIPNKGKYYRVRIGKFQSMEEARKFQSELERKRGVKTFVSPL